MNYQTQTILIFILILSGAFGMGLLSRKLKIDFQSLSGLLLVLSSSYILGVLTGGIF